MVDDQRTPVPEDDGYGHRAEELAHRVRQLLAAHDAHHGAAEALVAPLEALGHVALGAEGLDDTQPAEGLLDLADELAPQRLRLEAIALEALAHTPHNEARQWQDEEDEEREAPAQDEHTAEVDDDEDGVLQQQVEGAHHRVLHLADVPRDACQHITLALFAEEAQR